MKASRPSYRLSSVLAHVGMLPMEVGSLVMERKMLLGIKNRAEQLASNPGRPSRDVPARRSAGLSSSRVARGLIATPEVGLS